MKLYISRHAQPLPGISETGEYPAGDPPLSPLGREQAKMLGAHLSARGFHGTILSSPYRRAMETAVAVAEETGSVILPFAPIREVMMQPRGEFVGMTAAELARFPHAEVGNGFPYPWWSEDPESADDVRRRVKEGVCDRLDELSQGDVLLVTHGSPGAHLREELHLCHYRSTRMWNASLTAWDRETGENDVWDVSFLPDGLRTENGILCTDRYAAAEEGIRRAAAFAAEGGDVVLHIGDTYTFHYDYYRRLIAAVRPSAIVHTGDLADEDKAGRIDGDKPFWRRDVPELLGAMQASGARVFLVPGNNDLGRELPAMAPFASVVPRNTVVEFCGVPCCLCHEHHLIRADAAVYFYGHGTGGDPRTKDNNVQNGRRYFNAMWGASLHDFAHDRHLIVDYPAW